MPFAVEKRLGVGVIAVYSIKGGVGKTTTAFDLAWRMAALGGHRTLLWDLDLQGGAAFMLGEEQPRNPQAAAAFRPGGMLRSLVRKTEHAGLHLLPADHSLRVLPAELAQLRQRRRLTGLTQLLSGEFGRIVLDCPPALNEISDQILAAADLIVVPLPPTPLALRALDIIKGELAQFHHLRAPPLYPVFNMVDIRRKAHRDAVKAADGDWPVIPLASDIEKTSILQAPIDSFARHSKGALALAELHRAVEDRLGVLPPRTLPPMPDLPAARPQTGGMGAGRYHDAESDQPVRRFFQKLLRV